MSTKFTPGPWDAWIKRSTYSMTGPAAAASMTALHALRESGDAKLCVEMSSASMRCPALALGDTQEQAKANARLIASSPDLLALLIESQTGIGGDWRARRDAAIEKATGGAS